MKMFTQLITVAIFSLTVTAASAQCSNALDVGTPNGTSACYDFDAITSNSGSSACAGSGFGGPGTFRIVRFCTNATAECVVLDLSGLSGAGGVDVLLYTTCTGTNTVSGYVAGSGGCYATSTDVVFSTADDGLAPNTCYYARIWTKNPPTASSEICVYTETPPNDYCANALPVDGSVQLTDNYCMTAAVAGDPAPSQYCAGSLENNAWYTFTADPLCTNPCDVVVTFSNINCNGGAAGFQIGYWTGTCGALNYLGCTSGSGGTVTATITTTPGATVLFGLDGNAGAFCEFGISATNTVPLSVGLFDFYYEYVNEGIHLKWSSVTEENNDYFTLERSSDGVNFVEIAEIKGMGTSSTLTNYAFLDERPSIGMNYYRLSQTNVDGTSSSLGALAVETNSMFEGLMISPNPVAETASISFVSKSSETTSIEMLSVSGVVLHRSEHQIKAGTNNYSFNTSSLPAGLYFLRVSNSSETREIKFMK